jgi:hypothetical protein
VNRIRFPVGLAVTLLLAGTALFALSLYLEFRQLATLQAHPILVNLLSGTVGFCFGVPVLSLFINRVVESSMERRDALVTFQDVQRLRQDLFNGTLVLRDRTIMAAAWGDFLSELDRRGLLGYNAKPASAIRSYLALVRHPQEMSRFCDVVSEWTRTGLTALATDPSKLRDEARRLPELMEAVAVQIRDCRVAPTLAGFGRLIVAAREAAVLAGVAGMQQMADRPEPPPATLVTDDTDDPALLGRPRPVDWELLSLGDRATSAMTTLTLPDGREVVVVAGEQALNFWDPGSGRWTNEVLHVSGVRAMSAVPGPDGTPARLALADADGAQLWDGPLGDDRLFEDIGDITSMVTVHLPDGRILLAVSGTSYSTLFATGGGVLVRLYDATTGDRIPGFAASQGAVDHLATLRTSAGTLLLATAAGNRVQLWWDPSHPASIEPSDVDLEAKVVAMTAVAMPDGASALAFALDEGAIRLWFPETGEHLALPPADVPIRAMAATPGHLVAGGPDGVVAYRLPSNP